MRRETCNISFYSWEDPDGEPIHEFPFFENSTVVLHQPGDLVRLVVDIQEWTGKSSASSGTWETLQELRQLYEVTHVKPVDYWEIDKITHEVSVSVAYVVRPVEEN